jgi:2-dehydropantoate 2-reductase
VTRILVVGAGATGGYFGARLAQAGRDVTFLVRPRRALALREHGLRLTGLGPDEVLTPRLVTAGELATPYDVILLSVKADALGAALDDMAPAVGPDSVIVPFLNGIGHLDALTGRFGRAVLGGVVKVVTKLGADGEIVRLGTLADMVIGELDGGPSARVDALAGVLDVEGYDFAVTADAMGAMWHKWVFISTMTVVTCLMRGTVGEVAAVPGGARFATAVLAETAAVSAAAGHPVPEAELAATTALVTQEGSPFAPSMYRDVAAGLPTEVEHVLGDLGARARSFGVPTPLVDLATAHLRVHNNRVARRTPQG